MVEALIWAAAAFFIGGSSLLERRGLGQITLAHPLVLCLIAGYIIGDHEIGIWFGISLQLLSIGQGHAANWALAGLMAAITMCYTNRLGITLEPGDPASFAVMALAILGGIGARLLEKRQARIDGETQRCKPVWDDANPTRALEKLTHRRLERGFLAGGFQTVIASSVSILAVWLLRNTGSPEPGLWAIATLSLPTIGAASAISSLANFKFIIYAGVSLLVIFTATVII